VKRKLSGSVFYLCFSAVLGVAYVVKFPVANTVELEHHGITDPLGTGEARPVITATLNVAALPGALRVSVTSERGQVQTK
jgi:hypothetical protein